VQLGYLLSEISAFYNAFAYMPGGAEPVDHISVQAEFIAYLRFKQAYALVCGEEEKVSITAEASSEFMREHLARIAGPLTAGLGPIAPSYLIAAAQIVAARSGSARPELARLHVLDDEEEAQCETPC
jgi:hypothetical protein